MTPKDFDPYIFKLKLFTPPHLITSEISNTLSETPILKQSTLYKAETVITLHEISFLISKWGFTRGTTPSSKKST